MLKVLVVGVALIIASFGVEPWLRRHHVALPWRALLDILAFVALFYAGRQGLKSLEDFFDE